ncbi:MAG: 4Fe-4S dicluster domain-containing protein [Nitrospirae bacterium]|nr:4Fe-4S dicluster domain-containing protein [Magnetococcales bacterium]HAT50822.1 electron transfer flavoprotein-ubiquinone oxidoreductase [Alphaproteobacteria bacterium]
MNTTELAFDCIIVGAGPSGLAAAIHLGQLSPRPLAICLLEKGAYPGAHVISGAVMDPQGLDSLLPDWRRTLTLPWSTVTRETFFRLTPNQAYPLPHFNLFGNRGAILISLGQLCRHLAQQAQQAGVHIFSGFAACQPILDPHGTLRGVITGDRGKDSQGKPLANFQPGVRLTAPITLIAEGARGHLASTLIRHFHLDRGKTPQHFALGVKEVWNIPPEKSQSGTVEHVVGWPLGHGNSGGGFIYHSQKGRLDVGLIVNLNYTNPMTNPMALLQCLKTHPLLQERLTGGSPSEAGARVLVKGGIQSLPFPAFPGGLLLGDAAGFLDGARMKGIDHALLSGMAAAQTVIALRDTPATSTQWGYHYWQQLQATILPTLKRARNVQPGLELGLGWGMIHGLVDQKLLRGTAPWTWRCHHPDRSPRKNGGPCTQPQPCHGPMVIDRDQMLFLAGVEHRENQPPHVHLERTIRGNPTISPEHHYCPAGVFSPTGNPEKQESRLRPHRCLHCQTCVIKDPDAAITWTPPEGGSGPHYRSL